MALDFPQPQMDPTAGPEDEEGMTVDMDAPQIFDEMEENEDGSVKVQMEEIKGPMDDQDFYGNLAEDMESWDLSKLAMKYIDLIEKDKNARKERDKQYEEGLKRTGLGNDAPGGATFMGASKVVSPMMAEACVDFESRAIKELFPPDGPVRTALTGKVEEADTRKAESKRDLMNWQLTEQISEFRDEQEVMLTQLPLGGSQYLNMWWDEKMKRPCAEFVPIDNVFLPYACNSFYTASRVTHMQDITEMEFRERVERGLYRDVDLLTPPEELELTASEKANQKIEGKKFEDNEDGIRRVYHIYVQMEAEADTHSKGEIAPYIMMVDEQSTDVLGLYRNWEIEDETMSKLDWMVEFKFIPWRGAYAIGLPHLAGGLTAAATGALRALLDTAHINNTATMLKLKGAKFSGQSQQVDVTQVCEIEGAPGIDDIRKIAMPMPFNPPSEVLFKLLGWLTDAGKGIITTSEEKIADVTSNAPVGTTQALIEQGAAVFSAIHSRLHDSQRRMLKVLSRINRWYLDEMKLPENLKQLELRREDFAKMTDVIPVSDPHIFSETQRMAQTQSVIALMDKYPAAFDQKAVVTRMLKQLRVQNVDELMPQAVEPTEQNAADENASMALGRPAYAYPHQSHLAHLQSHLDFALNPALGGNAIFGPMLMPLMLDHLKHHITLWYTGHMHQYVEKSLGKPVTHYDLPEITGEIDKLYALASQHVQMDTQSTMEKVVPALQKIQAMAQQFAPKPQLDPDAQVVLQTSMAETQRRAAKDQVDAKIAEQKLQADQLYKNRQQQIDIATDASDKLTEERIKTAELTHDAKILRHEQEKTALTALQGAQETLGGENGNI